MCAPDPNAGIRMQAKITHEKEKQRYNAESLKYWNKELSYKQGKWRVNKGYSRTKGDIQSLAFDQLKNARMKDAAIQRELAQYERGSLGPIKSGEQAVSRSRRFGRKKYLDVLSKRGELESQISSIYGKKYAEAQQKALIQRQAQAAEVREAVPQEPIFATTYMPPRDTQGQMYSNMMTALSIASLFIPSPVKV